MKKIIVYTIPIILTNVLQLLFNAADLVIVGRFCGSVCVAAVGATSSVVNLTIGLFVGLSVGAGVAVARAIGAQRSERVSQAVHTIVPTALLAGLFVSVFGVLAARWMLVLMDTPENVLPLSVLYLRIYFGGMIFNLFYNFGASILRAAGDTRGPLFYLTAAGALNVLLNVLFVTLFHMNVAGVALATVISQALSALLVLRALMRRSDSCRLYPAKLRFYKRPMVEMLRIGLPAGLQGALFSLSNVVIQSSINSFGSLAMAGCAAAANLEGFVYLTMNAFYQTSMNFTGQNAGAGNYKRVKKVLSYCLTLVSAVGIVLGVAFYVFSPALLGIYITDSPEAVHHGVVRMLYNCGPYFLCGLMEVVTGVLRGMGVSLAPMLVSVFGVIGVRLGWIFTVFQAERYHTLAGLMLSYPVSWAATFAVQLLICILIYRKRVRHMEAIAA